MKLTRYESFMLYILGFVDCVETLFVKHFRIGVFSFLLFFVYNLGGGSDQGKISPSETISYFITALLVCVVLYLIYKILVYKNRIRSSKKRNVNRNH